MKPNIEIITKMEFRILVNTNDYPSNIKLKTTAIITPASCPPNNKIPDAVA